MAAEEILSFLRVTQPAVVNLDLTSKGPVLIASLLYSSSSQDPVYSVYVPWMEASDGEMVSHLLSPLGSTHGFATARTLQGGRIPQETENPPEAYSSLGWF